MKSLLFESSKNVDIACYDKNNLELVLKDLQWVICGDYMGDNEKLFRPPQHFLAFLHQLPRFCHEIRSITYLFQIVLSKIKVFIS